VLRGLATQLLWGSDYPQVAAGSISGAGGTEVDEGVAFRSACAACANTPASNVVAARRANSDRHLFETFPGLMVIPTNSRREVVEARCC
jgi:hypothetical protein